MSRSAQVESCLHDDQPWYSINQSVAISRGFKHTIRLTVVLAIIQRVLVRDEGNPYGHSTRRTSKVTIGYLDLPQMNSS